MLNGPRNMVEYSLKKDRSWRFAASSIGLLVSYQLFASKANYNLSGKLPP